MGADVAEVGAELRQRLSTPRIQRSQLPVVVVYDRGRIRAKRDYATSGTLFERLATLVTASVASALNKTDTFNDISSDHQKPRRRMV